MELIFEFIKEILMEIPGAFFRWLYFGRKESFSEFLKNSSIYNYLFSFLFIIVIVLIIVAVYHT